MLRLIDMQQMLLHSTTVEKVQQVQQQHADVEKKYFALHFQEEIEQRKKEVQGSKECEGAKIKGEEKRKKREKSYMAKVEKEAAEKCNLRKELLPELDQGKILDLIV